MTCVHVHAACSCCCSCCLLLHRGARKCLVHVLLKNGCLALPCLGQTVSLGSKLNWQALIAWWPVGAGWRALILHLYIRLHRRLRKSHGKRPSSMLQRHVRAAARHSARWRCEKWCSASITHGKHMQQVDAQRHAAKR